MLLHCPLKKNTVIFLIHENKKECLIGTSKHSNYKLNLDFNNNKLNSKRSLQYLFNLTIKYKSYFCNISYLTHY